MRACILITWTHSALLSEPNCLQQSQADIHSWQFIRRMKLQLTLLTHSPTVQSSSMKFLMLRFY